MFQYIDTLKDIFIEGARYKYIIQGLTFSVGVTFFSAVIGIILGILFALMRISRFYPLKHSKNFKDFNPLEWKRQEEYRWFALAAFLCVLLEVLLRNSILKKIP